MIKRDQDHPLTPRRSVEEQAAEVARWSALSRRAVLVAAANVGAAMAVPFPLTPQSARAQAQASFAFFSPDEAALVNAIVARLLPSVDGKPGGTEAGVSTYIDRLLAGPFGRGAMVYLEGPFAKGTESQGYQDRFTLAEIYRLGLKSLAESVAQTNGGQRFGSLSPEAQDGVLRDLEGGKIDLQPLFGALLFETLYAHALEGFFSDPQYGGNRDMVGWKHVGFPGSYAAYADWIGQHGVRFPLAPISIADHRGHEGAMGVPHAHGPAKP